MKIALIGYGKMGQEIERVLADTKHTVVSVSYRTMSDSLDTTGIKEADVAVDFTSPEIVVKNIETVLSLGTNMVVGTTGWYDHLRSVEGLAKKYKRGLMYGQNFSIGANVFFQIAGFAAKLFAKFPDYDIGGIEYHHNAKKDSPSGTAKKLADIIMIHNKAKKKLVSGSLNRQIKKEELHFASLRVGRYFGFHEVLFDSTSDTVSLSHTAHNRTGFAKGALWAAEFIKGKKGLYSFDEVFKKEMLT